MDSSFSSSSSSSSPSSSDVVTPFQKSIEFPKLGKNENSIVIINSRTDHFEVDKISNVLRSAIGEKEETFQMF